jgi:hypothetical protein
MMKLVHARAGEQRRISANKSAGNRFVDRIAMQLFLGMRKYLIDALSFSGAVAFRSF